MIHPPRSVEAPELWLKMAVQILWDVEQTWKKKKMGFILRQAKVAIIRFAVLCGQTTDGSYLEDAPGTNDERVDRGS